MRGVVKYQQRSNILQSWTKVLAPLEPFQKMHHFSSFNRKPPNRMDKIIDTLIKPWVNYFISSMWSSFKLTQNWSQLECIKVDSAFVLCATPSTEKRKKSRELSEDFRSKIVEEYQQSQGYKSISRDLKVSLSTVQYNQLVYNPWNCGKSPWTWMEEDERMQRRIVRMVDKQPQSTSTQIQAVLLTQGATASARTTRRHLNEMKRYGRRPRRTTLVSLQFARTYPSKPQGECFVDRWD